jgi:hypothetical protein
VVGTNRRTILLALQSFEGCLHVLQGHPMQSCRQPPWRPGGAPPRGFPAGSCAVNHRRVYQWGRSSWSLPALVWSVANRLTSRLENFGGHLSLNASQFVREFSYLIAHASASIGTRAATPVRLLPRLGFRACPERSSVPRLFFVCGFIPIAVGGDEMRDS